jgi:hypothetical protein
MTTAPPSLQYLQIQAVLTRGSSHLTLALNNGAASPLERRHGLQPTEQHPQGLSPGPSLRKDPAGNSSVFLYDTLHCPRMEDLPTSLPVERVWAAQGIVEPPNRLTGPNVSFPSSRAVFPLVIMFLRLFAKSVSYVFSLLTAAVRVAAS